MAILDMETRINTMFSKYFQQAKEFFSKNKNKNVLEFLLMYNVSNLEHAKILQLSFIITNEKIVSNAKYYQFETMTMYSYTKQENEHEVIQSFKCFLNFDNFIFSFALPITRCLCVNNLAIHDYNSSVNWDQVYLFKNHFINNGGNIQKEINPGNNIDWRFRKSQSFFENKNLWNDFSNNNIDYQYFVENNKNKDLKVDLNFIHEISDKYKNNDIDYNYYAIPIFNSNINSESFEKLLTKDLEILNELLKTKTVSFESKQDTLFTTEYKNNFMSDKDNLLLISELKIKDEWININEKDFWKIYPTVLKFN